MAILETSVSRYSLSVDASETINVMVESADNPWGCRLYDALTQAMGPHTTYAVRPYVRVRHADFDPRDSQRCEEIPEVGGASVDAVLAKMADAGLVTTRTVLAETSSEGYLSDGRAVTAVEVLRPFALVTVEYFSSPAAAYPSLWWGGEIYDDSWRVVVRSYIVPAGWYLVGEVGEFRYSLGVAGMSGDSDDTFDWLWGLEGFGASECAAECGSCGARWAAQAGSWKFRADDCDAEPWNFDDAEDIDEDANTVGCPQCGTGRVGFMIF